MNVNKISNWMHECEAQIAIKIDNDIYTHLYNNFARSLWIMGLNTNFKCSVCFSNFKCMVEYERTYRFICPINRELMTTSLHKMGWANNLAKCDQWETMQKDACHWEVKQNTIYLSNVQFNISNKRLPVWM